MVVWFVFVMSFVGWEEREKRRIKRVIRCFFFIYIFGLGRGEIILGVGLVLCFGEDNFFFLGI